VSGYTEYYICCCGFKRGCCRCDPFAWREDDDDAPPLGEILPRAEGRGQQGAPPANNPAPQPLLPGRSLPCIALRGCCRLRPSCHRRGAATLPASPQRAHQYFCCCWHSNPAASARQRSQPTPLSAPPAAPKLLQLCATRDFAKSIFPPSLSLLLLLARQRAAVLCLCVCDVYLCAAAGLFCLLQTAGKSTESASFLCSGSRELFLQRQMYSSVSLSEKGFISLLAYFCNALPDFPSTFVYCRDLT
jgi:hypothetical protein